MFKGTDSSEILVPQQVETAVGYALKEENVSNMERRPGGRKGDRLANETCRLVPKCQSQVLDFIVEQCAPG